MNITQPDNFPNKKLSAKKELQNLMSEISERCWCAGWMHGLEYRLWYAIVEFNKSNDVDLSYGTGNITYEEIKELIKLNKECDGWWHFNDDPFELVFSNTKSWIKQFNEGGGLDYDF